MVHDPDMMEKTSCIEQNTLFSNDIGCFNYTCSSFNEFSHLNRESSIYVSHKLINRVCHKLWYIVHGIMYKANECLKGLFIFKGSNRTALRLMKN